MTKVLEPVGEVIFNIAEIIIKEYWQLACTNKFI